MSTTKTVVTMVVALAAMAAAALATLYPVAIAPVLVIGRTLAGL